MEWMTADRVRHDRAGSLVPAPLAGLVGASRVSFRAG
jgi:hypothetical protein